MAQPPRKKGRFALIDPGEMSGAARKRLWSERMEEDEIRDKQASGIGQSGNQSAFPALGTPNPLVKDTGKFLKISAKDPDVKIGLKSPILVEKFLNDAFPSHQLARKTKDGGIMLKTRNKAQAEPSRLSKFATMGDVEVEFRLIDSMNKSTGRIYADELLHDDIESILDQLKEQGVIAVRRINRKNEAGQERPTPILLLDFDSPQRPQRVKIGWQRYLVRTHYPRVRQCTNCWKFGHWKEDCKNESLCQSCSTPIGTHHTCGPIKCVNCPEGEGGHPNDTNCPQFEIESAIRKIRTDENVSHGTAERILKRRVRAIVVQEARPYATTLSLRPALAPVSQSDTGSFQSQNLKRLDDEIMACTQERQAIQEKTERLRKEIAALEEEQKTLKELLARRDKLKMENAKLLQQLGKNPRDETEPETDTDGNAKKQRKDPSEDEAEQNEREKKTLLRLRQHQYDELGDSAKKECYDIDCEVSKKSNGLLFARWCVNDRGQIVWDQVRVEDRDALDIVLQIVTDGF